MRSDGKRQGPMRPLKPCTRGLRPLDPFRRCSGTRRTNKLRLQLERRQASFRAKKSPEASRKMNGFIFRSVVRLSLCALRTAWPAKLACPKTALWVFIATAESCLMSKSFNIRLWRGPGRAALPGRVRGKAPACPFSPPIPRFFTPW